MILWLLKPRRSFWLYILTLVIVSIWLYFLSGPYFSWMGYRNGSGDLAQHLSGWYAFVYEPWHFPLLKINLLDYPVGTNISLTDSIPLFACFFKLIRGVLPPGFNFFAIFFVFCYVSQAVAATTLACSLNQKNVLATLAFTVFAISAPIFSSGVAGEDSLSCHALILFALALYFFNKNQRLSLWKLNIYFGLIIGLSLLVHPYLTAMCYPFYLVNLYLYKKSHATESIFPMFLLVHCILVLEFLVFGLGSPYTGRDFGRFNMNLLAPVYGGYFAKTPPPYASPDQGGIAYLGGGLIILILLSFYLNKAKLKKIIQNHSALLVLGVLFFIYSIYGDVDLGKIQLIHLPIPYHFFITDQFRSNGRFFWPCFYILLCFALTTILTRTPKVACFILPLLIILQLFDLQSYFKNTQQALNSTFQINADAAASNAKIMAKMAQSNLIIYYPKLGCDQITNAESNLLTATQELAARSHTPMNTAYIARAKRKENHKICGDDSPRFSHISPQLLVSDTDKPSPTMLSLLHAEPTKCEMIGQGYYCLYSPTAHTKPS